MKRKSELFNTDLTRDRSERLRVLKSDRSERLRVFNTVRSQGGREAITP